MLGVVVIYIAFIIGSWIIITRPLNGKNLNSKREQKALESGDVYKRENAKVLDNKPIPHDLTITSDNVYNESLDNSRVRFTSQNRVKEFAKGAAMAVLSPGMIAGELAGKAIGNVAGKGARFVASKAEPHLRKITGPALALGEKTFKAAKFYKTLAVEKGKHYAIQAKDKAVGWIPEDTRRKIKFYSTLGVEKGKHYAIQAGRVIKSTQGYKLGQRGLITMKGAVTADAYLTRSFRAPKGTALRLKAENEVKQTALNKIDTKKEDNLEKRLASKQNELADFQQKIAEARKVPNNEAQIHMLEMEELRAKTDVEDILNQMKEKDDKNIEPKFSELDYSQESERKSNLENERNEILKYLETEKDKNIRQEMENDIKRIDEELQRIQNGDAKSSLESERSKILKSLETEKDAKIRQEMESDIRRIDEELQRIQNEETKSKNNLDVSVNKLTVNMNPKLEILKSGVREARQHGLTSKEAVMYSNLKKQMIEQEIKAEDNNTTFNRAEVQEYLVPAIQETSKEKVTENVSSKEVYQTVERAVEQKHNEDTMVRVAAKMHAEAKVDFEKEARKALDDLLSSDKAKEQLAEKIMNLDKMQDNINLTEETEGRVSELETLMKKAGKDIKKLRQDAIIKDGKPDEDIIKDITEALDKEIAKDPNSQLVKGVLGEEAFQEFSTSLERNVERTVAKNVQKYLDNSERTKDEEFIDRNIETHPEYADLGPVEKHELRVDDDRRRHIRTAMDETYKDIERTTNDNRVATSSVRSTRNNEPVNGRNEFSQNRFRSNSQSRNNKNNGYNRNRYKRYSIKTDNGIKGKAV